MAQLLTPQNCPRCGSTMVRRQRRSDGAVFLGCSRFPRCRGTRELAAAADAAARPAAASAYRPEHGQRPRYDRLVLACGALGGLIGIGFLVVGLNSRPNTYAFIGMVLLGLNALVVLPSPWLPQRFARASALRVALLCVFVAGFLIAWIPVSTWFGQVLANQMLQALPTYSPSLH
jgi:hypothetical protein